VIVRDDLPLSDIDLGDPEFWNGAREHRESVFATLRKHSPVHFFEEREFPPFPKGVGYYALTRYDDVWAASRNPVLFCSGQGSNIGDLPQEINEFFGSMINMDDPKHARLRGIVARGFTPKTIAKVDDYVRIRAASIVDRAIENYGSGTPFDFVEEIAAKLPLEIICDMMGIPETDHGLIFGWTNVILGAGDPEYGGTFEKLMETALAMYTYAQTLGEDRLANRRDDITSEMMHAEVDGERLTAQEFGSFFILLVVAGNETTRNAISHGMKLLTDNPDQRKTWFDDFETHTRTATEEIVRLATPVIHFRRTVTADTELSGVKLVAGTKVVMWYNSANRDETKWKNPHEFDVTRELNPQQVGFGAGGPHFCLGANLARREISVMFDEIRRRLPNLQIVDEPSYLQSYFINGIKHLTATI
jgi:methyl-branched lipid omega-hydroxylase